MKISHICVASLQILLLLKDVSLIYLSPLFINIVPTPLLGPSSSALGSSLDEPAYEADPGMPVEAVDRDKEATPGIAV